jgi:DnaJ-class molecular chaperone
LTVPKGANAGSTLRLKGRGLPDSRTGLRGDLLARVQIVLPEERDLDLERFAEAWRRERPYTPKRKGRG